MEIADFRDCIERWRPAIAGIALVETVLDVLRLDLFVRSEADVSVAGDFVAEETVAASDAAVACMATCGRRCKRKSLVRMNAFPAEGRIAYRLLLRWP